MAISEQFLEYVLDQLSGVYRLTSRRMFSGVGLYSDAVFFGLLYRDRLYFKTDETSRPEYESRGSEPFRPWPNAKRMKLNYYTVPADIIEDRDDVLGWAKRAVSSAAAAAADKEKQKKKGKAKTKVKSPAVRRKRKPAHSAAGTTR